MQTIDNTVTQLRWILEQAKIKVIEVNDNEHPHIGRAVELTLSSGVLITVYAGERKEISILGIRIVPCIVFEIGYNKVVHGGYWEPDDTEYIEVDTFDNIYAAVSSALLLAEEWRIDSMLENISIQEIGFRFDANGQFVQIKQEDIIKNGGC